MNKKRGWSWGVMLFFTLILVGNSIDLTTFTVFATQESCLMEENALDNETVSESEVRNIVPETDLPDNEELFAGYVEQQFYNNGSISLYGLSARERLNTQEKQLYDFLKAKIESVAMGNTASTVFSVDKDTFDSWDVMTTFTASDVNAAFSSFLEQFDMEKVIDALLHDCPYDLYWFDKTSGISQRGSFYGKGTYTIRSLSFAFKVAGNYQADNYSGDAPTVNTTTTGATSMAVINANAVVTKNAAKSDYEKLTAYRDYICAEVSYNSDAVSSSYTDGYGDPWQLIYVFDGNENTNVVCEGYSKAFQYLCDLTTFNDDVFCYTVTGSMFSSTGGGGHMWNVVTMENGKNYLVDVTNSDAGTIGSLGGLFLAGTSGSVSDGYIFALSKNLTFTYDSDMMELWGTDDSSILNLAGSNYVQMEKTDISEVVVNLSANSYIYDGTEKKPAVTIENLRVGTDFKVSYSDNVNAGTATVTIIGRNMYTGTVSKEFTIAPKEITNPTIELSETIYVYDGSEKRPTVILKDGSTNIDFGEYTVSYSDNINAGIATVTITDNEGGNYTVNGSTTFTIVDNVSTKDEENVTTSDNTTEQNTVEQSTTEQNTTKQSTAETVPVVGTILTDTKTKAVYKVITANNPKGTVVYMKPTNKTLKTITIPATVTLNGITYKVTKIADNAFKNNKNIKKITIGKNVTTIGEKAFYNCTALTKITIPSKVNKIGKRAFYGCKKLKNITIKTTKLTKKNVGSKAFKGISTKAVIKVPKKKLKNYKSLLKAKGVSSKAKIKK